MNSVTETFKKHGVWASYHYADDSGKEWVHGYTEKKLALIIFDDNPDLQAEMREIATDFLWSLKSERPES